jgi:hypothetical protein
MLEAMRSLITSLQNTGYREQYSILSKYSQTWADALRTESESIIEPVVAEKKQEPASAPTTAEDSRLAPLDKKAKPVMRKLSPLFMSETERADVGRNPDVYLKEFVDGVSSLLNRYVRTVPSGQIANKYLARVYEVFKNPIGVPELIALKEVTDAAYVSAQSGTDMDAVEAISFLEKGFGAVVELAYESLTTPEFSEGRAIDGAPTTKQILNTRELMLEMGLLTLASTSMIEELKSASRAIYTATGGPKVTSNGRLPLVTANQVFPQLVAELENKIARDYFSNEVVEVQEGYTNLGPKGASKFDIDVTYNSGNAYSIRYRVNNGVWEAKRADIKAEKYSNKLSPNQIKALNDYLAKENKKTCD